MFPPFLLKMLSQVRSWLSDLVLFLCNSLCSSLKVRSIFLKAFWLHDHYTTVFHMILQDVTLVYSPPPHPKSHHSTSFFFIQSIICWTEHPRLVMASGVMYSFLLGKAYFKFLKTGKLCQHFSHALLKSFWKLNPTRQIPHQVGYIRSSGQNRWFGGGDTTVQTLVPTITLKIVLPKTLQLFSDSLLL